MAELTLDPRVTRPDVSNRAVDGFVAYVRERFGEERLRRVFEGLPLPVEYFDDDRGWVSSDFVELLTLHLLHEFGGVDGLVPHAHPAWRLFREAGRMTLRRDRVGAVWPMLRALGSPAMFMRTLPTLIARANRMTRIELVHQGRGVSVLRAQPVEGSARDIPGYCWNRQGALEAAPTIWGLPLARVEHTECMHSARHPADACVYRVYYQERSTVPRALSALGAGGAAAAAWFGAGALSLPTSSAGLAAALGAAGVLGAIGWGAAFRERRAYRDLNEQFIRVVETSDDRYSHLWNDKQALRRALLANRKISGYLASSLVEEIMSDPDMELRLGGERIHAAVLFADIVGYTPRCESAPPERVVHELNTYFAHIDPVIDRHGGVIDKRMGDGIMVVFVRRTPDEASVEQRAVSCALDMLRGVGTCNAALAAEGAAPLTIRVGVAAGELVQGNLGSDVRLEYTVIGDIVNLAARLESQATPGHVLVERTSGEPLPPDATLASDRTIRVKGKEQPVAVRELRPA